MRNRDLEYERKRDARRQDTQSLKAKLWRADHPYYDRDRRKNERGPSGKHREPQFLTAKELVRPLYFKSENLAVVGDFHSPFDSPLMWEKLLAAQKEYSIEDLAINGDLWDCDNYKKHINLPYGETFKQEIEHAAMRLQILCDTFKRIFICKGNHEHRWIKENFGRAGMDELFALTKIHDGYELTEANWMRCSTSRGDWLICHPFQYRQTKLSLANEVAEKYHVNVICGHGHFFSQGWSKSGHYQICDGGGMFDAASLIYLWDITTYPWTQNGFYLVQDGYAKPVEGERKNELHKG